MKVYVASSLDNASKIKEYIQLLQSSGHTISYDWTHHGKISDPIQCEKIAVLESDGVRQCEVLIMVQPARTGSHVEFGIALAMHKPIIIVEEVEVENKTFYHMPGVYRVNCINEAINLLSVVEPPRLINIVDMNANTKHIISYDHLYIKHSIYGWYITHIPPNHKNIFYIDRQIMFSYNCDYFKEIHEALDVFGRFAILNNRTQPIYAKVKPHSMTLT